jgi:hypothetical protein
MGENARSAHDKAATRAHLEAYLGSYPGLRGRVCRVLLLHLHTMGLARIEEVYRLAERGEEGQALVDPNVPSAQLWAADEKEAINEIVIDLAAEHLSPGEVDKIVWAAHQRDEAKSVEALARMPDVPLDLVAHKVTQYASIAGTAAEDGVVPPTPEGTMVALLRRFVSESVEYISVAKRYLGIHDMSWVLERVISTEQGSGWVGGKAAGMLVAWAILRTQGFHDVALPNTVFVLTDAYGAFKEHNGLTELSDHKYNPMAEIRDDYRAIRAVFHNAEFPPRIVNRLRAELARWGEVPLVVRSSSLLEDSFGAAFAGIYQSLFLANQGPPEDRLRRLLAAIAEVYTGVFSPSAISYRRRHDLIDHNELMAVMIQPVVGTTYGPFFCPAVAGVAFSRNDFRWNARIRREDGLARLVLGLGTHAVDRVGDFARMVPLKAPTIRPEGTPDEIAAASQRRVDVLAMDGSGFCTVSKEEALEAMRPTGIADYVSVIEPGGHLTRPVGTRVTAPAGRLCLTFERLLDGPFPDRMHSVLSTLEEAYRVPVDFEFALDDGKLHVLQCRPLGSREEGARYPVPDDVSPVDQIFSTRRWVNNGCVEGIEYIILVDPRDYASIEDFDRRLEVGRVIGQLNDKLADKCFMLMGPGRWGSQDVRLGVRVAFSDIANADVLVEIARKHEGYVPEPSFGTHFFQELVEAAILYLPLYPDDPESVFNDAVLRDGPNDLADLAPECASFADVVRVIDVARACPGRSVRLVMDGELQEALCFVR